MEVGERSEFRRRRLAWILALALGVIVAGAWLLARQEPPVGAATSRRPDAETADAPGLQGLPPRARTPAAPPGLSRVQVRWLLELRPASGVELLLVHPSQADRMAQVTVAEDGWISAPWDGGFLVRGQDPSTRCLRADRPYPNQEFGEVCWLYRSATLRGRITLEGDTGAGATDRIRVAVKSIHTAVGRFVPDPSEVGSTAWFEAVAPREALTKIQLAAPEFAVEVPILGEIGVAAAAPGFAVAFARVPQIALERGDARVELVLRKAEVIRVAVEGRDGLPVHRARVQYMVQREMPEAEFPLALERLAKSVTGVGMGVVTRGGRAAVERTVAGDTDAEGSVTLTMPYAGEQRVVIVHAAGHVAGIMRVREPDEATVVRVVLDTRAEGAPDHHRLIYRGTPLLEATLVVCEEIDGWTPALPPIQGTRDGLYAATMLDPLRTYTVVIEDWTAKRTLSGRLTFGTQVDVDVGALRGD
jgi:hypothetical protein